MPIDHFVNSFHPIFKAELHLILLFFAEILKFLLIHLYFERIEFSGAALVKLNQLRNLEFFVEVITFMLLLFTYERTPHFSLLAASAVQKFVDDGIQKFVEKS